MEVLCAFVGRGPTGVRRPNDADAITAGAHNFVENAEISRGVRGVLAGNAGRQLRISAEQPR
jgi:hypothetical protein